MAKAKAREQASASRALVSGWAEQVSQLLHNLAVQAVGAPPGLTPGRCSATGRGRACHLAARMWWGQCMGSQLVGGWSGCHVALVLASAEIPAVHEVLVGVFHTSLPAPISGGTVGSAMMSELGGPCLTVAPQVLLCCAASAEDLTCDA